MARQLRNLFVAGTLMVAAACNKPAPSGSATTSTPAGPVRGGSLTASTRAAPQTFNRLAPRAQSSAIDAITRLVHVSPVFKYGTSVPRWNNLC